MKERGEGERPYEGNHSPAPPPPTDQCPTSLQAAAVLEASFFFLYLQFLLLSMMLWGIEYAFDRFGSAVLAVFPSQVFFPPWESPLRGDDDKVGRKIKPWPCARTVQRQLKYCHVINKAQIVTHPKHNTIEAAVKKINSMPARPSTYTNSSGWKKENTVLWIFRITWS